MRMHIRLRGIWERVGQKGLGLGFRFRRDVSNVQGRWLHVQKEQTDNSNNDRSNSACNCIGTPRIKTKREQAKT